MRADRLLLALDVLYWYWGNGRGALPEYPRRPHHLNFDVRSVEKAFKGRRYAGVKYAFECTDDYAIHRFLNSLQPSGHLFLLTASIDALSHSQYRNPDMKPLIRFFEDIESERLTLRDFQEAA